MKVAGGKMGWRWGNILVIIVIIVIHAMRAIFVIQRETFLLTTNWGCGIVVGMIMRLTI